MVAAQAGAGRIWPPPPERHGAAGHDREKRRAWRLFLCGVVERQEEAQSAAQRAISGLLAGVWAWWQRIILRTSAIWWQRAALRGHLRVHRGGQTRRQRAAQRHGSGVLTVVLNDPLNGWGWRAKKCRPKGHISCLSEGSKMA